MAARKHPATLQVQNHFLRHLAVKSFAAFCRKKRPLLWVEWRFYGLKRTLLRVEWRFACFLLSESPFRSRRTAGVSLFWIYFILRLPCYRLCFPAGGGVFSSCRSVGGGAFGLCRPIGGDAFSLCRSVGGGAFGLYFPLAAVFSDRAAPLAAVVSVCASPLSNIFSDGASQQNNSRRHGA